MTDLDLSKLSERINDQKKETTFYRKAIQYLIEVHNIHFHNTVGHLFERYSELSYDFLDKIANGVLPSEDDCFAEESECLDYLVQDQLFLFGVASGVEKLRRYKANEYADFIMASATDKECGSLLHAFSALTLLCNTPPSRGMLFRISPASTNKDIVAENWMILGEMNCCVVESWIESQESATENK